MKKLVILCLSLLLCACAVNKPANTAHRVKRDPVVGIQSVSYKKLQKLMKSDREFILYIGRPDCGDCQEFRPILESYLKKHKDEGVYYLNIKAYRDASLKKNASKSEKMFYENLRKNFHFDWTPTLEVISAGKIGRKYTYLDMDYYNITDRAKQIKKQKEFVKKFKDFMADYYKKS